MMWATVMKKLLLIALCLPLAIAAPEQPYHGVSEIFEVWFSAKISRFELSEASFEQAHEKLAAEWKAKHPTMGFPMKLGDFEKIDHSEPARITLSLKEVPFCQALDLVCKASGRRLLPTEAGWIHLDRPKPTGDGWSTRGYPISSESLAKLKVGEDSSPEELRAALTRMGMEFESWMRLKVQGDQLWVLARETQHQQIAVISSLLEKGCTITPPGMR
jgi:hypothetical protein